MCAITVLKIYIAMFALMVVISYALCARCMYDRERDRVREGGREGGKEREYLFYAKQLSCQRWIICVGIWALGNEHRAVRWGMSSPSALLLFTCRFTYLLYYHYEDQNPFFLIHKSLPKPQFHVQHYIKCKLSCLWWQISQELHTFAALWGFLAFLANWIVLLWLIYLRNI